MSIFHLSHTHSLPLHIQLLDELREKVKTGALPAHTRLPGEWELVEELGISRATIQRAWQAAQEEGLIYRIAGKGTFVAEQSSPSVRGTVGFFIPEYRGTFAVQMLTRAERILRQHGFKIQFAVTDRRISEENRLLADLIRDRASGCILVPISHKDPQPRMLTSEALPLPVVLMDHPLPGTQHPCVTSQNYEGGIQATQHLLSLGHQRILFLARDHLHLHTVSERWRGYRTAMRAAGASPLPPLLVGTGRGEMSSYEAYEDTDISEMQPLLDILTSVDRPTALFAANDWIALKAQRALSTVGLRVPHDISLVGFDDLDIASLHTPPLTTVAQDAGLIGAEAAHRLIMHIEGAPPANVMTLVPTRLVVRESTRSLHIAENIAE